MNEFEFIRRVTHRAPRAMQDLMRGVGDDCAIIADGERDLLITTDTLVENVHFKLPYTDERSLGGRMLNVNISDIAAMGGTPRFFLSAITVPSHVGPDRCLELYEGMYAAAEMHNIALIGGDTTSGAQLVVTITLIGEVLHDTALLRSGARPGDVIYVTGNLGDAALGLACLEADCGVPEAAPFISRYRLPQPRIAAGRWLAETGMVTSMIDISDGLLADVGHLASASETGYEVDVDKVPHHHDLANVALNISADPRNIMLGGGDDYELAFTIDGSRTRAFEALLGTKPLPFDHPITRIGTMVEDASRRIARAADGSRIEISIRGYDHFAEGPKVP